MHCTFWRLCRAAVSPYGAAQRTTATTPHFAIINMQGLRTTLPSRAAAVARAARAGCGPHRPPTPQAKRSVGGQAPAHAPARVRERATPHLLRRRPARPRALAPVRAAADAERSPLPVAVAIGAPVAALAASSAAISSGAISPDALDGAARLSGSAGTATQPVPLISADLRSSTTGARARPGAEALAPCGDNKAPPCTDPQRTCTRRPGLFLMRTRTASCPSLS